MEESVALLCLQAKGWHRSQSTAPLLLGRAWLFAFTTPLSRGKGHLLSLSSRGRVHPAVTLTGPEDLCRTWGCCLVTARKLTQSRALSRTVVHPGCECVLTGQAVA